MGGAVISRGLMLVASILVARMLGKTGYGELGMIRSTVGMFGVFAGFGLGLTATKHVAEFREKDPERAGRIIGLSGLFAMATGGLMAVGLFVFAPWLAEHTINAPHLAPQLRLTSLALLITAMNGAYLGALAGFEDFKSIAIVNLLSGAISFPLLVGGAYFAGLTGAVLGFVLSLIATCYINRIAVQRNIVSDNIRCSIRECLAETSILWRFSLPATLAGIMVVPAQWTCNAILVNGAGGYGQMALYEAAGQWRLIILFIPGAVGRIALPMLASFSGKDDRKQFKNLLLFNASLNGAVTLAVAAPIAIFSRSIMVTYGNDFHDGARALSVLAISTVVISITNSVGQAIVSKGQMWHGFFLNSAWAVTIVLLAYFFIRQGKGAYGLAMANLIAALMHFTWVTAYVFFILRRNH